MKKVLIALLFGVLASSSVFAQRRVAFTNIELIMSVMPAMQQIQKEVDEQEKKLTANLKVTQDYYQQKVQEYYAQKEAGMTMEMEKKMVNEIAGLEEELMAKQEKIEEQLMAIRIQKLNPVQTQLQKAINEVAKEKGYSFVINQVMGEGIPSILYGKPEHDITEAVLEKLGVKLPENTEENKPE